MSEWREGLNLARIYELEENLIIIVPEQKQPTKTVLASRSHSSRHRPAHKNKHKLKLGEVWWLEEGSLEHKTEQEFFL